jgi:hypothetical protein
MVEAPATKTRLLVVREIQEDEGGAVLRFQQGDHGRLASRDANFVTYLRLARRSLERQHPVGVRFGEGHTIAELIRADNDVPGQLWEEAPDRARVLFQGHDGIFRLKPDDPESARLRALLGEALRQQARVWFIAHKPDLALLDVLPAEAATAALPTGDAGGTEARARQQTAVAFVNAFYIKLGRGGCHEADAIETGKLRFGWRRQSVEDINAARWEQIEQQLRNEHQGKPRGVATSDLNALRNITESLPEDVWITFHKAKLWWTRLAGPVEEDSVSRFRRTSVPWSDRAANGRLLVINELPGKISQLQGFRGTVCRVQYAELLQRTLNGTRSPLAAAISGQLTSLAQYLTEAIKELHWKDFETLVDLVFRAAGWIRVSVLGQHAKAYDLELREPITGSRYVVQVKSRAGIADLKATLAQFSPEDFQRIFFVVHSPEDDLVAASDIPDHVKIVSPEELGKLALNAGLAGWLEDKVS